MKQELKKIQNMTDEEREEYPLVVDHLTKVTNINIIINIIRFTIHQMEEKN